MQITITEVRIYVQVCIHAYVHTYICIYIHTYIHCICVMVWGRKLGGSKSTAGLHSRCSPATLM